MIMDFTGTQLVMVVVAVDSKQSPRCTEPAGCKGSSAWSPKASGSPVWRFMGRGQAWGRQDRMGCCGIPAHLQTSYREHGVGEGAVQAKPWPGKDGGTAVQALSPSWPDPWLLTGPQEPPEAAVSPWSGAGEGRGGGPVNPECKAREAAKRVKHRKSTKLLNKQPKVSTGTCSGAEQ